MRSLSTLLAADGKLDAVQSVGFYLTLTKLTILRFQIRLPDPATNYPTRHPASRFDNLKFQI